MVGDKECAEALERRRLVIHSECSAARGAEQFYKLLRHSSRDGNRKQTSRPYSWAMPGPGLRVRDIRLRGVPFATRSFPSGA